MMNKVKQFKITFKNSQNLEKLEVLQSLYDVGFKGELEITLSITESQHAKDLFKICSRMKLKTPSIKITIIDPRKSDLEPEFSISTLKNRLTSLYYRIDENTWTYIKLQGRVSAEFKSRDSEEAFILCDQDFTLSFEFERADMFNFEKRGEFHNADVVFLPDQSLCIHA
jgi:hypothetical protein